jgi:hypothetical protein
MGWRSTDLQDREDEAQEDVRQLVPDGGTLTLTGWYLTGTLTLTIRTDDGDGLAPDWCSYSNGGIGLPRIQTGDRLNDEGDSNGAQADVQRRGAGTTVLLRKRRNRPTEDPQGFDSGARRIQVLDLLKNHQKRAPGW